jgi:CBS domain-containing protein
MILDQTALEAKRFGVYTCGNCVTLGDAVRQMVPEDISSLVIVDDQGYLVGLLSRTDLIRAAIEQPDHWHDLPVSDVMAQDVITVPPEATLQDVSTILLNRHIHRVVVAEDEGGKKRPLSVISATDIVYHMAKEI